MGKRDDIIEINLAELFAVLWARAFLIISAGLFFALAGLFLSKFVLHPVYDSTTKIYILNKEENQTVTYSADFREISDADYIADEWSDKSSGYLQRGFITAYSQHSDREDFAEMMSEYITNSAETWDGWIAAAGDGVEC